MLFLKECPPSELRSMKYVLERVELVKEFCLSSKAKEIHKFANTPTLFAQQTQPLGVDFIIVPIVSLAIIAGVIVFFVKRKSQPKTQNSESEANIANI